MLGSQIIPQCRKSGWMVVQLNAILMSFIGNVGLLFYLLLLKNKPKSAVTRS